MFVGVTVTGAVVVLVNGTKEGVNAVGVEAVRLLAIRWRVASIAES